MRITVFTPTYNRAYSLSRLFESLKAQSFHDFEWVIVDDGSSDNTSEVVSGFMKETPFFEIKYRKTENGGKHRAINRGMDLVSGDLFLVMDSDDWLREDALEWIDRVENSIPSDRKKEFAGVYGLKCYPNGTLIGSTFDGEMLDASYFERRKYRLLGDKAEAYYSEILRKYPFPEFEGEKFCTECLVWDQIAATGLKLRFFNQKICFCEYLEDGLTRMGNLLYARNPKQYGWYVHNHFVYGKADKFHSMIKIYEYYLYEKEDLRFSEIISNLHLSVGVVLISICTQWAVDLVRWLFHHKKTVRGSVKSDLERMGKSFR